MIPILRLSSCRCLSFLLVPDRSSTAVKVPRHKLEGRWFDSRRCHWNFSLTLNPDRTTALGSTQPLTEMSTRSISWGKGCWCVRLTALPPSCAVVMKSGNRNFLEPSGPVQACNGTALPFLPVVCVKIGNGMWSNTNSVNLMFIGPCVILIVE